MQKTVTFMGFQSEAAWRRRFPDVSENTTVVIFRVNEYAGIGVGQWRTQDFFRGGGSTNSVEDRRQRERVLGAVVL
jgi:hypothetical protein